MFAIETAFLNIEVADDETEKANHAVNTFYALCDAIKATSEDLESLADDEAVVDAIYTTNDVKYKIVL